MPVDYFNDFREPLQAELTKVLAPLAEDADNYGFALAVPSDYASAFLVYAIGKESALASDSVDYRYSPVEWMPTWLPLSSANEALERAVERFNAEYERIEDAEAQDQMHDQFISDCAIACLEVLEDCDRAGLFGKIWYKVLDMSDEEHPIVAKSFRSLNSGRALAEAAPLFDY